MNCVLSAQVRAAMAWRAVADCEEERVSGHLDSPFKSDAAAVCFFFISHFIFISHLITPGCFYYELGSHSYYRRSNRSHSLSSCLLLCVVWMGFFCVSFCWCRPHWQLATHITHARQRQQMPRLRRTTFLFHFLLLLLLVAHNIVVLG